MRTRLALYGVVACLVVCAMWTDAAAAPRLTPLQRLGRHLFFDTDLSTPPGQSCATCHDPSAGFADPREAFPTSQGIVPVCFGNRNSPTAAYLLGGPEALTLMGGEYVGGNFWDGRANGLIEQAMGPFLNPLEMHNPNKTRVVNAVRHARYAHMFTMLFGDDIFDDVDAAYEAIATAIAAYEKSSEVNPFSSKMDYFLEGKATFTPLEQMGMMVFHNKGSCMDCHAMGWMGGHTLLTNHGYFNLGTPRNPANPYYTLPPYFNPDGASYIDYGLGGVLAERGISGAEAEMGKHKVPTLRNVAVTAPYMHNGVFPTLKKVIEFYNNRDVEGAGWDPPEVDHPNIFRDKNYGNLGLTEMEINAIVAFLGTFTDGYVPETPAVASASSIAPTGMESILEKPVVMGSYPNPFNPQTTITFALPEAGRIRLAVYDVTGRQIRVLLDEPMPVGMGSANWDGRDTNGQSVASGIYFCRLDAGKLRQTTRLVLLR